MKTDLASVVDDFVEESGDNCDHEAFNSVEQQSGLQCEPEVETNPSSSQFVPDDDKVQERCLQSECFDGRLHRIGGCNRTDGIQISLLNQGTHEGSNNHGDIVELTSEDAESKTEDDVAEVEVFTLMVLSADSSVQHREHSNDDTEDEADHESDDAPEEEETH